jgi:hypothetical protein
MRRLDVGCGLILVLSLVGVIEAQVIRSGPVGGGISVGPIGGGIGGGLGYSGPNGPVGGSIRDLGLNTTLPNAGPVPEVQQVQRAHAAQQATYPVAHEASGAYETSVPAQESAAEPDDQQSDGYASVMVEPTPTDAESYEASHEVSRAVHAGSPPEAGDSDEDDDSDEGTPWWVWLLIALVVAAVLDRKSR